jgi:EmrB/QacA subfamily drug resistance transporter
MQKTSNTKWIVPGLLIGLFVAALDQTIVATAMPTVVSELGGFEYFVWVFSAYMIATVVSTPIFGKLSDIYGRKRFFLFGLVLFVIGSMLCGIAQSMTELIIFRVIQGIGGGSLMPITFAIIFDIFPPEKRGKMNGLFGAVFGLSSVFGPSAGAYFTDYLDWRWVFFINLPIGIVAFIMIALNYREGTVFRQQKIDWTGATLLIGTILTLMFGIELGGSEIYAWDSWQIISLFASSLILFVALLRVENKVSDPIVNLDLFRNRMFSLSQSVSFLYGVVMIMGATYIPLFIQGVYGESASATGQTLTPMMLAVVASSVIGGRFVNKTSYRNLMVISSVILIVALFLLSTLTSETPRWEVTIFMIAVGLGIGMNFSVLNIAALHGVDKSQNGAAVSLITFFRTIGSAMGVVVFGVIQAHLFRSSIAESIANPTVQNQLDNPRALLIPEVRQNMPSDVIENATSALANSISTLYAIGMGVVVIALICAIFMGNTRMVVSRKEKEEDIKHAEMV